MERWIKTGSVKPENHQPSTSARSKEESGHSVDVTTLESTMPDVEVRKEIKKRKYCDSYLDMGFTEFADGRPHM